MSSKIELPRIASNVKTPASSDDSAKTMRTPISEKHLSSMSLGLRNLPKIISKANKNVKFNKNESTDDETGASVGGGKKNKSKKLKAKKKKKVTSDSIVSENAVTESFLGSIFNDQDTKQQTADLATKSLDLKQQNASENNDEFEESLAMFENINESDYEEFMMKQNKILMIKEKLLLIGTSTNLCDVPTNLVYKLVYMITHERWVPAVQTCKQLLFLQPNNPALNNYYKLLQALLNNRKIIKKYKIKPVRVYKPKLLPGDVEEVNKDGYKHSKFKSKRANNQQKMQLVNAVQLEGVSETQTIHLLDDNELFNFDNHNNNMNNEQQEHHKQQQHPTKKHKAQKKRVANKHSSANMRMSLDQELVLGSRNNSVKDEIEFKLTVEVISNKLNQSAKIIADKN